MSIPLYPVSKLYGNDKEIENHHVVNDQIEDIYKEEDIIED